MAEYKSRYTGEEIDAGIAKANTAIQEHQDLSGKQDVLESGTNIKTINGQNILGSGDITIEGGSVEANPVLEGNEEYLKGLKVGNTKYSTEPDLSGKVISILGDSISTFDGWIPNGSDRRNLFHAPYYPKTWFTDVTKTWWYRLIFDEFKAKLGVNDSWSGSYIGNNKDTDTATYDSRGNNAGPNAAMASITRITNLGANGTPDIIYFYGGTNDIASPGTPGESLGTFNNSTDYSTVDLITYKWTYFVDAFRNAIMRLQYYYPKAKIIVLLPTYTNTYYNRAKLEQWLEQMKEICDYFGVNYIDLRGCGITWSNRDITLGDGNIHPNEYGMSLITDYVKRKTLSILENDNVENVVYTITNNLTTLTNVDRYIKGVTKGNSFSATLTGTDLTLGRVSMDGTDITSTSYNSVTGVVSINNVTGNIVISEGEPILTPVAGVSLNADTKSIMPNDVETLTATIVPANATNRTVTWSANNNNVTLNPNGLSCEVTGATNGTSVVTVTTDDGNYTASCTFTVHEIELDSIAITTPPSTTSYHYGDIFSKAGMVVTAYYNDNTSEVLEDTDYTVSPSGALTDSDTSVTVSYTYNGVTKTATQNITVATLDSIAVTTQPNKTSYLPGQTFNPDGMVVTATWSDNTTSTVTGYTFSPSGALTAQDTTITISYTIGGITETTAQTITFIAGIVWYDNVTDSYTSSGGLTSNPASGYFAQSEAETRNKYVGTTLNVVRLIPKEAGVVTFSVFNYVSNIIGRTDSNLLQDTSQIATITIPTSDVGNTVKEYALSNELVIGENQFWAAHTTTDTGKWAYKNASLKGWSKLGQNGVAVANPPITLYIDMGYSNNNS